MATLQTEFIKFHEAIKLKNLDENKTLREKRDVLLDKLRKGLATKFADQSVPTFSVRNQGSYSIDTGVLPPAAGDYDIDVALVFNIDEDEVNPVELKQWVHEVLDTAPHNAMFKRPCVTVQYTQDGEDTFHVDFAIYAAAKTAGGVPKLAVGFPGSATANKSWEPSDFEGLLAALQGRFTNPEESAQYRRAIRYLKRWKDVQFATSGEAAPKGIGLAGAAYKGFQPVFTVDTVSGQRTYDDRQALNHLVSQMLAAFQQGSGGRRLAVRLPAEPYGDPFERMSDKQMEVFKTKLQGLHDQLAESGRSADPVTAAEGLSKLLGPAFPVPSKASTAAAVAGPAVLSTGHYA